MVNSLKRLIKKIGLFAPLFDVLFLPILVLSSLWLRLVKFIGLKKFFLTQKTLKSIGVFPIVNHYYEPQFVFDDYQQQYRHLPAINFNEKQQLEIINSFNYQQELLDKPSSNAPSKTFFYNNGSFPSGDAECYYSLVRKFTPKMIIEIGSGYSTLIANEAIGKNLEQGKPGTKLICIEPYEMPWLNELEITLIRKKVENVELTFFEQLTTNDILFIDSSHMIRPQGDVLYEVLHILPQLKSGVLVHFHDIFSPLNYPEDWLKNEYRLWNEQYLIEAFLSNNDAFEIVVAMSYLTYNYKKQVHQAFPVLAQNPNRIPGSLWIRKK